MCLEQDCLESNPGAATSQLCDPELAATRVKGLNTYEALRKHLIHGKHVVNITQFWVLSSYEWCD